MSQNIAMVLSMPILLFVPVNGISSFATRVRTTKRGV